MTKVKILKKCLTLELMFWYNSINCFSFNQTGGQEMPRKKQAASDGLGDATESSVAEIEVNADEGKVRAGKRANRASDEDKPVRPERDPGRMKALDTTLATLEKE